MCNYSILEDKIKYFELDFIKKISYGLNKVNTHFLSDMVNGFIKSNSVNLSDHARVNYTNPNIKKYVERIERHLDSYNKIENVVNSNYINLVKPYINPKKLYFVDGSDIVKNDNTKFENKGYVCDGSDSHKVKQGYIIKEIDTIDNANQPISLYSELISRNSVVEESDNLMWLNCIKNVSDTYGNGTFICDRGYDSGLMMGKVIELGNDFIIRANKLNRLVTFKNNKYKVRELAKKTKGYYNYHTNIKGTAYDLKVTAKEININEKFTNKSIYAVFIKGFAIDETNLNEAYMVLYTSRKLLDKTDVLNVVKDYATRWKIEENFKYKKQQFKLEKIMVRRYKRIVHLYNLLSKILFLNNIINLSSYGKTVRKLVPQIREKINYWLYRISDGLIEIIKITGKKIIELLYPKSRQRTSNLFTKGNFNKFKMSYLIS